jgi:general stress protein YciG
MGTSNRGFASMDDNKQRDIASKGGKSSHSSNTGGTSSQQDNPGNFANDREKASRAGKKGGENSSTTPTNT